MHSHLHEYFLKTNTTEVFCFVQHWRFFLYLWLVGNTVLKIDSILKIAWHVYNFLTCNLYFLFSAYNFLICNLYFSSVQKSVHAFMHWPVSYVHLVEYKQMQNYNLLILIIKKDILKK